MDMHEIYASPHFQAEYTYSGTDLGAHWTPEKTSFRLWAPTAQSVSLRIYSGGTAGTQDLVQELPMEPACQGTWQAALSGDWNGFYYTYLVKHGSSAQEACDPYAVSTGVNGHRAMILDLRSTDPELWENDRDPHGGAPITDAVIYEVHVRDFTIDPSSGVQQKGRYCGLMQAGTHTKKGCPTGLSHIKNLGITHVQLMPVYDYGSVDEQSPSFNWGYDPMNYNTPEGSYSSDPYHGQVRVRELKQLVKTLHDNGLSVVMDVVYNHVFETDHFSFNQVVPGYFSRPGSNGSGCGNDTASERPMVRKFIADSLKYWVEEYHIDGFRFDLAGLIDAAAIRQAMEAILPDHPNVLFYGEGWTMDTLTCAPNVTLATQQASGVLPGFGFFNDSLRDLVRGSVFLPKDLGFAAGGIVDTDSLRSCFMGVTPWACTPGQSINYVSCHDNHTLLDRLALALPKAGKEELYRRSRLAAAFNILSQGVPFFLSGEEMLRSKPLGRGKFDENSYRSPDKVNSIKWSQLEQPEYDKNLRYYQGLLAFRKIHPSLRKTSREDVLASITPIDCGDPRTLAFRIRSRVERMLVIFHAGTEPARFALPDGTWNQYINAEQAGGELLGQVADSIELPPISASVFVQPKPTEIKDVAAALIWKEGRFLICQRPAHKARGLKWEFVGGKREGNETLPETLIRECREELGITVQPGALFTQVRHDYPDIYIQLSLFHCTISDGEPQALEHNALRWIFPSEIPDYDFCPADKDILSKIMDKYK